MPSTLGYWNIRGVAQPVRLMLHYVGEEYEEKNYKIEGPPDYKNDWFDKKFDLGLELANLPYYLDGDVKMSQSCAILRHLGKKYGLVATNEADARRQDQALFEGEDMSHFLGELAYDKNFEELKEMYIMIRLKALVLPALEHFIGDRSFMVGEKLNYADFRVYESLSQHLLLAPDCLKDFPKLAAYMKRFEDLPAIKAFLESKDFIKEPICNCMAFWSNKPRA